MLDQPWIVVIKGKKGWIVAHSFKKGNEAEELRLGLLRSEKYEEVIVAFNPFYKVP